MLKELRIKNLAIVDDLVLRFGRGLNILTGETGAGKSIIVDALGLALGERAQAEMIRSGEKEAVVQAYLELADYGVLQDLGADFSDGLLLRRNLSTGGKSRAYINDILVTLQTLSEAGKSLVDVHSQHEHQSLLSSEKQLQLVDSFGKLGGERGVVERLYAELKELEEEYAALSARVRERAHRLDLLRFQADEIEAAALSPGEKESLDRERQILSNISRLRGLAEEAYSLLYDSDGSGAERLSRAATRLGEICAIDEAVRDIAESLASAKALVEDACFALRATMEKYDFEPARLEEIEGRLETIKNLERKYGEGVEGVLAYRDSCFEEIRGLESADGRLSSIEERLKNKRLDLLEAAGILSTRRKQSAREIESRVRAVLRELAFSRAEFRIEIKPYGNDNGTAPVVHSHGMDRIEYLFSANAGEAPKGLAKIASGGELSRVMLALKSTLADADEVPVLIFDEIDAGIGGAAAESVGRKLKAISRKSQVICITHLPQIASFGDLHCKIEKKEKNGRVCVEVKELQGKDRQDEIARMLSGKITEISRSHADELLGRSR